MNDLTPGTSRHDITAWLHDRYGLQLYLESTDDGSPALHLADDEGATVRVGGYDRAVALAEALRATTRELGGSTPASLATWIEVPEYLADLDQDRHDYATEAARRAHAFPCGVPGCQGQSHEWEDDPSQFIHKLERIEAGRLKIETYVPAERDTVHVDVYLEDHNGADYTTENELLALAAELRSYATIVERQVNALELHNAQLKRSQS